VLVIETFPYLTYLLCRVKHGGEIDIEMHDRLQKGAVSRERP
jgi:hypothetical protein